MTWNWLDVVIILLALGQVGVAVYIVLIVLRIKNGPVARLTWLVKRNVQAGKRFYETGKKVGLESVPPAMRIRSSVMGLTKSFRPVTFTDAPVTYASLKKPLALLGTVEAALAAVKGAKAEAKARPRSKSHQFLDRLGLIPPAWAKIAPLIGYAGTALAVFQQVQEQLPEIRSRLLFARDTD